MTSLPPSPWITPAELARHLTDSAESWLVLDARFDLMDPAAGQRSFESGHVPGARYLHLEHDLARPRGPTDGRHPLPTREAAANRFAAAGVRHARTVVVMDADNALYAARAWWMLRALGHRDVRVLSGGFAAWRRAGLPEERGPATADVDGAHGDFVADDAAPPGFATVDAAGLWTGVQSGDLLAIDVRAPERYAGLVEPLDPVAGHIPGARNLPYAALLAPDGTLLPPARLRTCIRDVLGDTPPARAALYCGSGVTACAVHLAFLTAALDAPAGDDAWRESGAPLVYPGSWSEWCRLPGRPVATGTTP